MKVIDGKFGEGKKGDKAMPSDCFQAFADAASEIEDKGAVDGTCAVVYYVDGELHVGSTEQEAETYYLLSVALHSMMMGTESDTVH